MTSRCRDVRLPGGEVIRVRGDRPPTERDAEILAEIVDAARKMAAERPEPTAEQLARRQRLLDAEEAERG